MARLNSSKIVDSDSDDELPEMSTIFSAKSIATPRKNLIPRASSLAPESGPNTGAKKARRRVLGKATDNSLLRPLGKDSPAPEFEGRRDRKKVLGKTLFDDEDEQPRARRAESRPRAFLRRKIQEINLEENEESEDGEAEVESTYVRPRNVRRAPRTVQASASEQAVKPAPKPKRDVLQDFGNLTLQMSEDELGEEVIKSRSTWTQAVRKSSPPKYVEPESSEPEEIEEEAHEEEIVEEAKALSESEDEPVAESPPARRSIPTVVLRAYEPLDNEQSQAGEKEEVQQDSVSETEDESPVKPQPARRKVARNGTLPLVSESEHSESEEVDVLGASCLKGDLETKPVPKAILLTLPQARLPSNIFNALHHLPPPKTSSPGPAQTLEPDVEDEDSEEHLNTLEASCLEDDDEGEVEEGTAEVREVYEHRESEEEEDEEDADSDDMSDFIASDVDEEASVASDSEIAFSEEDFPVRQAPRSIRRLVKGRKAASPSPPPKALSKEPVVEFQWSDDDREEEKRPVPADVSRKLFGISSNVNKRRGLPTLSDSEEDNETPILDPYTPSESESEIPEKERTPRSIKKQPETSKRLKSPTKPKFPRAIVSPPRRQSNDAFWEPEVINKWHDEYSPQKKLFQSPTKSAKPISKLRLGGEEVSEIDFSKTSSKASIARAKKAKKDAIKEFEAKKNGIALAFLEELDQKVTGGQIAKMSETTGGVKIIWSAKLNTTAGRAHWRREGKCYRPSEANPNPVPVYNHHCSIELASKVITEEHRLINVLAHEFCHLTTFMISKELKNPHGAEFKSWGRKVEKAFGDRDVEVTTKHSYEIAWKYVWQCQSCRGDVGRHSKSVDPKRMRCGVCKGELVQIKPVPRGGAAVRPSTLFPDLNKKDGDSAFFDGTMRESSGNAGRKAPAAPKQLTDYQEFVKEHMARIKADNPGSPMKEVMGLVGAKYREQKAGRKLFGEQGRLKEMKLNAAENDMDKMSRRISVMDLTSP